MINIFLFVCLVFIFTFLVGKLIEKIKVPWIFAGLILGSIFAIYNPFVSITSSQTFNFLAQLGMYFLLFIIGFEIDLKEIKKQSKFILNTMFFIIFVSALFGAIVIRFVFNYNWFISSIVSLSFATVGEAVLIPILDRFKIVNSKLGQTIIGIGTLDDIIEILVLSIVVILIGTGVHSQFNVGIILSSLVLLFVLTIGLTKLKKEGKKFNFLSIDSLFLFTLFILFLFLGVGQYAQAAPLAALLSGIGLKTFIPKERLKQIENEIRAMCYGFFAPLFFFWVGLTMNMHYLFTYPLLLLLVVVVSGGAKILGSYIITKKRLGTKKSILLGIGLSVRFSTSIIVMKILFENKIIGDDLYSVIMASGVIFTFIIPVLFSNLLVKYNIAQPSRGE